MLKISFKTTHVTNFDCLVLKCKEYVTEHREASNVHNLRTIEGHSFTFQCSYKINM